MFTIEKYQNFSEVIILKSPEELCLSYEVFLGLYGNARINYLPEERFLKIRLNHSIDNEKFGKILRYLLTQDALKDFKSFEESSYHNSAKRWKRYV